MNYQEEFNAMVSKLNFKERSIANTSFSIGKKLGILEEREANLKLQKSLTDQMVEAMFQDQKAEEQKAVSEEVDNKIRKEYIDNEIEEDMKLDVKDV